MLDYMFKKKICSASLRCKLLSKRTESWNQSEERAVGMWNQREASPYEIDQCTASRPGSTRHMSAISSIR